jgi:transcriptional regulator of arginine metabolism
LSKPARQQAIVELLGGRAVASQEDLRRQLVRRGFRVTQATLSRDIHELGLVKTPEGYQAPPDEPAPEPALPAVERLLREFVTSVRQAKNMVVIKTMAGSAPPVAAAIDAEKWPEAVGTIAGDDTILIVSEDDESAARLRSRIQGDLRG